MRVMRPAMFALTVVVCGKVSAQREIYSRPAPASHEKATTSQLATVTTSRSSGRTVVSIPLDNAGIGDWRFSNPRRPARMPSTIEIEFDNQTSDRTFEVTTTVALKAGDLSPSTLPSTAPLLMYDVLTTGDQPIVSVLATRWA